MTRKIKIINFVVSLISVLLSVYLISVLSAERFAGNTGKLILFYLLSILISSLVCAFIHELGHLLGAKISRFKIVSFTVWFFRWKRVRNRFDFSLCFPDDTGATEFYPTTDKNLEKYFAKTTRCGLIFSAIPILFCLPIFFNLNLSLFTFALTSCFLPIGLYMLISNAIPLVENGVRNDGAVLRGIKVQDDTTKVMFSLLKIQTELSNGKSFKDIDEKLFFDVPQLPEDDLYFALILLYRYRFYLDKKDYVNAKKVLERLISLKKYLPKQFYNEISAERIFYSTVIELNEDLADDLMYENEKFLNNVNDNVTIRAKLGYISFVKHEKEPFDIFYDKGVKEAKLQHLSGLKTFELDMLDLIKLKLN